MSDDTIVATIESTVSSALPEVEVWDVEVVPVEGLVRVLVDRPGGVDHELCVEVTHLLAPVRGPYTLEVSSPGLERPLVRTAHFLGAIGETVQVRLRAPLAGSRTVRGRLVRADDTVVVLDRGDDGQVELARDTISKSNIVWNPVTP